ncbi:acyltransferase [Orrella sp. NBD-18]|uniref:Acyltransferase n=1 Tax=Sheuella amnicola TaxID=2707330 RepID=A0A6B2R0B2_9BURK|nr:acyltransferase [Sheuella amnicola]NDY83458.1 acyltransferase [Sheuella amnicola]
MEKRSAIPILDLTESSHLNSLDGFRACLALWVYFGHLADASGFQTRLLSLHPLAVDLFMVLSGFLMVHTWKQDLQQTKFLSQSTLNFYLMRFFRIAPLYYLLLLICYAFGPSLAMMHDFILKTLPPPWAQNIENFDPRTDWSFISFRWIYFHISFLFGLVPGMENSTPLPDWSLSLEMQFYFVFPLLLVLWRKIPTLLIAIGLAVLAFWAPKLWGNYLDAGILSHFGQPSFLPYRLNAFFAGMLVALWLRQRNTAQPIKRLSNILFPLAACICILPLSKPVILGYLFFVAISFEKMPLVSPLLSLKPLRFLGDISYSIYLCHILIVYPIVYVLTQTADFLQRSPIERFSISLFLTLPLVILSSYILYRFVELPSIRFGKKISRGPRQSP